MKAGRRREYKGEGGRRLLWGERTEELACEVLFVCSSISCNVFGGPKLRVKSSRSVSREDRGGVFVGEGGARTELSCARNGDWRRGRTENKQTNLKT